MLPTRPGPHVGIALAGGGPLAAVYEIGALAALEESIEGFHANASDIYVGVSAGAIVAAGLANGVTPRQMVRLFIESDVPGAGAEDLFKPSIMMQPAFGELAGRLSSIPLLLAASLWQFFARREDFGSAFGRMRHALPAGVLSGAGVERYLRAAFASAGRSNDFRTLARKLVLVATDIDSGEAVRLGEGEFADVPVSLAVQASAAVPGLFPPVRVHDRYLADGALRKTMNASVALEYGVDILFCINPIVPHRARRSGKLAQAGLVDVLSQALRAMLHSRLDAAMARYARTHPDAAIFLFQPAEEDSELFEAGIFSYANRRRLCEQAYQSTRLVLYEGRKEYARKLARHGMRLKTAVLRDPALRLVGQQRPRRRAAGTLQRLSNTLDELERYLKLAQA